MLHDQWLIVRKFHGLVLHKKNWLSSRLMWTQAATQDDLSCGTVRYSAPDSMFILAIMMSTMTIFRCSARWCQYYFHLKQALCVCCCREIHSKISHRTGVCKHVWIISSSFNMAFHENPRLVENLGDAATISSQLPVNAYLLTWQHHFLVITLHHLARFHVKSDQDSIETTETHVIP